MQKLRSILTDYDAIRKRADNEELRRQRLAYINISLDNVLPEKRKKKRHRSDVEDDDDDDDEDGSERSDSEVVCWPKSCFFVLHQSLICLGIGCGFNLRFKMKRILRAIKGFEFTVW